MNQPVPRASFERQYLYYRRLCASLGEDLQRAQEERTRLTGEVRLHQLQARFDRDLSHTAAYALDTEQLMGRLLELLAEYMLCTKALILAERATGKGEFAVVSALGCDEDTRHLVFEVGEPPTVAQIPGDHGTPASIRQALLPLLDHLGGGPMVWQYDADSGYALAILGGSGPAGQIFRQQGTELSHTALTGLIHGLWRIRSLERQPPARPPAPSPATTEAAERPDRGERTAPRRMDPAEPVIREGDIAEGIRKGGGIREVVVLGQDDGEYLVLVRPSWAAGFRRVTTYRGLSDRSFRDLNRLVTFVRKTCRFPGGIVLLDIQAQEARALRPGVPHLVHSNEAQAR